jgi:uncharacterized protein (TIGR02246 family)
VKSNHLLLLLALTFAAPPALAAPPDDAAAVLDRWVKAYSANDRAAIVKLYTADATFFGMRSPHLQIGPEHIANFFAHWPRTGTKVVIRYRHMTMLGDDAAVAIGYCQFRWEIGGKAYPRRARFSMTLVRHGAQWLIANQHFSPIASKRPVEELVPPADRSSVAPQ